MSTVEKEYPIKVTLSTGSQLTVYASRETIEWYGNVNTLVDSMIKPLKDVKRIEVELYCDFIEDLVTEVTYDITLEAWKTLGVRTVVYYNFDGMEEEERGYISFEDGWLPKYTMKEHPRYKKANSMITEDITNIRSAKLVNREARNQRSLDAYHNDPDTHNEKRMKRYYGNHEAEKKSNRESTRRYMERTVGRVFGAGKAGKKKA